MAMSELVNGHSNGASKKQPHGAPFEITELVELSVLAAFVIQKLGKASNPNIEAKIAEMGGTVNEHLLAQATEALQRRGILSYASGRRPSGERERQWVMRRTDFAPALEMAHITDLLPRLVATAEAKALIAELNGAEAEAAPDETKKATRPLGYDEYVTCVAKFLTINQLLGSQPSSPYLEALVKASKHRDVQADMRFWRDAASGDLALCSDALRGWLRTGLRTIGLSEAAASYVAVSDAVIVPQKKLTQAAFPIIDQRTNAGAGIATYECLAPHETFEVTFQLPTRGVMTPKQFKSWLARYAPNPIRGLSPARGARFGKAVLVGFRDLGPLYRGDAALRHVLPLVPPEYQGFYDEMIREAGELDLRKGKS